MHSTRQLNAPSPRAYVNDPTVLTPMPPKSMQLRADSSSAADPTKTACRHGSESGVPMPRVGDIVLGFKLVDKLGEGGFGSVFLGEQLGLAARPVALKFTSRANQEPERLASLQHTNIVPVYSVHTIPPIQVLCMPYLGRQTLHDVLQMVSETKMFPATGAGLLSTLNAVQHDTKKKTKSRRAAISASTTVFPSEAASPATQPRPQPVRELLCRLSYPDSVVWLFSRLADGLAHAHERGILHLDLKPSNVLVTDDGVPMLLDFGLAYDVRSGHYDQTGGTLRYMSPEQLEAYVAQRGTTPDARMDLYSLGVMFYELLTGQHPFESSMQAGFSLSAILGARRAFAPRLRTLNPRVAPAVEAIILKLLQPDAELRYQTAAELLTDLTLHQENRPLKHTRNPSFVERVRKYRRRHPVLAVLGLAIALGLTTFGAAGAAIQQARQRTGAEASLRANQLRDETTALRIDLTSLANPKTRDDALAKVGVWFDLYGVTADSKWREQIAVRRLSGAERDRLADELGELALLGAHAEGLNAAGKTGHDKTAALERAAGWNRIAQNCHEGCELPLAVREQRMRLAEELARPDLAGEIAADRCRAEGPLEFYLRGLSLLADGRYKASAEALETLVDREPSHAAGQFTLAVAHQYAGRYTDAIERFQLAKALCPSDPRPAFNRGLVLALLNKHPEAIKEFTAAIQRDPKFSRAYYNRAISYSQRGQNTDAIADATRALDTGEPAYRTLLLRARLHDALGHPDRATSDRTAAAKLDLKDESDYLARGLMNADKDPAAALKDFAKAAELNPRYLAAWQNQAHILSERLDQPEQALDRLDRAVELNPGYAPALVGRAVIHARAGKRDEALKGAEFALAQSDDPLVRYQVACVYSILSKGDADESRIALDHLRVALREKFADYALIDTDADLANIRGSKEFAAIVGSAKALRAK